MAGSATTTTSCATTPICAFIIQSLQITIPNLRKSRDVLYAHLFHQSGSGYVFANQRSLLSQHQGIVAAGVCEKNMFIITTVFKLQLQSSSPLLLADITRSFQLLHKRTGFGGGNGLGGHDLF